MQFVLYSQKLANGIVTLRTEIQFKDRLGRRCVTPQYPHVNKQCPIISYDKV